MINKAAEKLNRIKKVVNFEEADRIPIGEFFWVPFVEKWKKEKGLPYETDINEYYDFDFVVITVNTCPKIKKVEVLERTDEYVIIKDGFGYNVKCIFGNNLPGYLSFPVKSAKEYKNFEFDDPLDSRRYYDPLDDLLSTSGQFITLPSMVDTCNKYKDNFVLCGCVNDPWEYLWKIRGFEEGLMDMVLYPKETKEFIERITDFNIQIGVKQIKMFNMKMIMLIGDIAYTNGMLFSPDKWRELIKPSLKKMVDAFLEAGAMVHYHGCGNAMAVLDDMVELGIEIYNPLQVKAGLNINELKKDYHKKMNFSGNIDVPLLEKGNKDEIKKEVLTKLNGAKGGGYIFMSDHSITTNVAVETYDYMYKLWKEYGTYPLELGEYSIDSE